jgi:Ca2+/Na+ antiporter
MKQTIKPLKRRIGIGIVYGLISFFYSLLRENEISIDAIVLTVCMFILYLHFRARDLDEKE